MLISTSCCACCCQCAELLPFITSCSQLIDTKTLDVLKTFATETPLNSASIHPTKPYVIVGGGQEAMNVTTTSARQGRFETRFWHKVFEEVRACEVALHEL